MNDLNTNKLAASQIIGKLSHCRILGVGTVSALGAFGGPSFHEGIRKDSVMVSVGIGEGKSRTGASHRADLKLVVFGGYVSYDLIEAGTVVAHNFFPVGGSLAKRVGQLKADIARVMA